MTHSWPFPTHSIYIPESCDAKQIESLSKSRLLQAEVFVGTQSPYLYIGTYQHPDIHIKSLQHPPKLKWQATPDRYDMPCVINQTLQEYEFLLIHSGKGQLYWRCKSSDFIKYCLSQGAQWAKPSPCDLRTSNL